MRLKILFTTIFSCLSVVVASAQDCYNYTRTQGISYYNRGEYQIAKNQFSAAKVCPDRPAGNDLDAWIGKCNAAIREAAERRAVKAREESESRAESTGYMKIKDIEFANKDSVKLISQYGAALYASDVKYLVARILYDGQTRTSRSINLYCRIIKPDGSLDRGDSVAWYSFSTSGTVNPGTENTINIIGWGSKNGGAYTAGDYRYEIWSKDQKLFEKAFTLYKKADEASYLSVSRTSVDYPASGGTKSFSVTTDATSYTLWGIPSWCEVEDRTAKSFTIRCLANSSTSSRTDYFEVRTKNKNVRVDVKQAEDNTRPMATIKSVWVDHNYVSGYARGMLIHVNFSVNNLLGRKATCNAYFWFMNGNKLKDYNNSFCSTDGQVSVGESFTPPYTNADYSDFRLFIPYPELHASAGQYKFYVEIHTSTTCLATSEYVSFSVMF